MESNRFLGSISASSIKNFFPKSVSTKQKMMKSVLRKPKANSENIPPIDSNIQISDPPLLPSSSFPKKSASKAIVVHEEVTRSDAMLGVSTPPSDSTVKVVVRIKPSSGRGSGDCAVKKISNDSVTVGDRKFTFDSVFDANSTQDEIFQLVGVPLVNYALAGYNTSILAYGQTGSGKTYTMWGPPSAMVECPSTDGLQGIVPRIFEMLFSKIQKDQENSDERQINYQCRCSFLEIYNEQIGDLLDPTQRNLQIKDDPKTGFYVENLTEEYVTSYEDITHILIKGLSSRKNGATTTNSKSSRSHIVFTCNIESWYKDTSSKCFGSSKVSRISLIDLAGFERNFPEDAGKQCLKEAKFVKKSTSHLGNLVNALARRSLSGIPEDIPYGNSCLTQLLRESLGGNAKLSVICAISPDNKFSGETASTLRFGQRVKFVQNEPVINEISEDDVNDLSNQIRLLKEELIRAKSNASDSLGNHDYFKGRSVRESLNQLRLSLNRSLLLPLNDNDCKEEVCTNENDVKELKAQIDRLHSAHEEDIKDTEDGCETDFTSEQYVSCSEESETEEISSEEIQTKLLHPNEVSAINLLQDIDNNSARDDCAVRSSILITARRQSEVLQEPSFSESPKIKNLSRKSLVLPVHGLANQEDAEEACEMSESVRHCNQIQSSLRSSRIFPGPTESLAASLQRGLEIIDHHQRNSVLNRSSVSFSFEHLALKPCPKVDKANASTQTLQRDRESSDAPTMAFLCRNCKQRGLVAPAEVEDSLKIWMIPIDEAKSSNRLDTENASIQAIERLKELENVCSEQAKKIEELNQLLIKYKLEAEQNSPNDEEENAFLLANESENESYLTNNVGNKLLMWNGAEKHDSELIKEKCEIKEIQEECYDSQKNQCFDKNEREDLLKEIEYLRSKLRLQSDATTNKSTEKIRSSLLAQSIQLRKSGAFVRGNSEEDIEKERQRWTEMESEWICLTDELRIDLESYRQRAEKVELELRLEKKCTEELDDALRRSVLGHGRMVEHYAELQEKYNELVERHRLVMQGVAEVKKAAAKAGAKGHGSRFSRCLAAELSALRVERDKERELLRKENKSLKIRLKDTAEAVHAAGELLVRLREAEESASVSEENFTKAQEENEKLKKQIEKLKRKHKMEMITMKQYLAESRLPESALGPFYKEEDSGIGQDDTTLTGDDDQAWRAEFGPIYQEHYC